jgi:elongation factor Ts
VLRRKGLAAAAKKASRHASNGLVGVCSDRGGAAVVEVNSETDFVARNDLFKLMVTGVASTALKLGTGHGTRTRELPMNEVSG